MWQQRKYSHEEHSSQESSCRTVSEREGNNCSKQVPQQQIGLSPTSNNVSAAKIQHLHTPALICLSLVRNNLTALQLLAPQPATAACLNPSATQGGRPAALPTYPQQPRRPQAHILLPITRLRVNAGPSTSIQCFAVKKATEATLPAPPKQYNNLQPPPTGLLVVLPFRACKLSSRCWPPNQHPLHC